MDDDAPKPKPEMTIGEDLSVISVAELQERILLLQGEIERIKADIEAKTSSRAAADSIFKS